MKIILQKDYPRLGAALDVLTVKDGYARNYLIPQGIALPATKGNLKHAEEMKKYSAKRADRQVAAAEELAGKLKDYSATIKVKVKGGEDLYGSVGVQELSDVLIADGYQVEKSSVILAEPIKKLGVYDIELKLHKSVSVSIKVWVVKEDVED
jgi:large subunit ribosomal protein L9